MKKIILCCQKGACDDITPITSEEEGEEASLLLAFELQQEEMALMQRHCGGGGIDDCSNDGAEGWMKDYHTFFGASLCSPVSFSSVMLYVCVFYVCILHMLYDIFVYLFYLHVSSPVGFIATSVIMLCY